MHQLLFVK